MKFELKYLTAVLAFAAVGAARADVQAIKAGGATFHGSSALTVSADVLDGLNAGHINVSSYGVATSAIEKGTDGYYTNISTSAPMQTLSLDTDSLQILGMGTKGGLTLTAPAINNVGRGGSLTVTDISADLSTRTIYATIIGDNGVGTINNVAVWTFATLTGPTVYTGNGQYVNDISGLTLTADGSTKFSQALGLPSLGALAITGVDYGAIHTVYDTTTICCGPVPNPSIPEPSSHALMGLGLVALALAGVARRRVD